MSIEHCFRKIKLYQWITKLKSITYINVGLIGLHQICWRAFQCRFLSIVRTGVTTCLKLRHLTTFFSTAPVYISLVWQRNYKYLFFDLIEKRSKYYFQFTIPEREWLRFFSRLILMIEKNSNTTAREVVAQAVMNFDIANLMKVDRRLWKSRTEKKITDQIPKTLRVCSHNLVVLIFIQLFQFRF